MSMLNLTRVVQVSEETHYMNVQVLHIEILSVIPYPLPPGKETINEVWSNPETRNWPIGGCLILLKNGTWFHVDESLDTVESSLLGVE